MFATFLVAKQDKAKTRQFFVSCKQVETKFMAEFGNQLHPPKLTLNCLLLNLDVHNKILPLLDVFCIPFGKETRNLTVNLHNPFLGSNYFSSIASAHTNVDSC